MLWSQHRELSWRARYSLLTVFTVLEGIVVCDLLAKFNFRFGLLVIILTLATSLGMIGFTYQTKYDFTDFPPLISAYTLTTLLVSPFALLFPTLDVNPVIGAGFLSALVSTYIIVEIYYLMRKLTQNDFIFAIAYLYVDLGYPVRCLHHICEVTERIPFANLAEED
ncbi:hypothetical protein BC938DRAFT_475073 [Jimgerdemannia flammicorona]|uniref:Uncharacterized protein n=1 Tax=Jimgerdemannia flammicorona TaxID=994334 RepID=A0A433QRZ3_9FUNG|nr:hypothetical protein BC938DRAFT_475073 [Jimgerdemannia flammicorona]